MIAIGVLFGFFPSRIQRKVVTRSGKSIVQDQEGHATFENLMDH